MTNAKTTKRALLSSIVSLILCFTMLLSTTYAWFTDTVTSGSNIITAGNLDVELYHTNNYVTTKEKVGGLTDLFTVKEGETFLWEPGAVLWENFEVANKGSLALKYQLALMFNAENATKNANGDTLAGVLDVAVVPGGFNGTREDAKQLDYRYDLKSFALESKLLAGESDVYGIVIYWKPNAPEIDNLYNMEGGMKIDLGVHLFATQLTDESDSFDNNYDVDAWNETADMRQTIVATASINTDGSASVEVNNAPSATVAKTTIDAPAGAFEATDKVEVEVATVNSLFDVKAAGGVVASLDINMTVNDVPTSADLAAGKYFIVTTYISKGLENVTVAYAGTDGKDQPIDINYDPVSGKLTFKTNHFSSYTVSGEALAYDAKSDTALTTPKAVIDAAKEEGSVVIIPDANKQAIDDYIEKELTDKEDKEAAQNAVANTKVGVVVGNEEELKAAIEKNEKSIIFGTDIKGNVTVPQTPDVKITIDGNGYKFAGVIVVDGKSGTYTTAGLTIKNVNFVAESISADACIRLGDGTNNTRYTCNVTVDNCTFDVPGAVGVKSYTGGDKNLVITGCTATEAAHSLVQAKGIDGILVENCKVNSKNGLNFNNSTNVTVDNCVVDVKGYAVRFGESSGGSGAAETYSIKNSSLVSENEDGDATIILRGTADNSTLTIDKDTTIKGDLAIANTAAGAKVIIDGNQLVTEVTDLDKLLASGEKVALSGDLNFNASATTANSGYGATGVSVKGGVLDGNGHSLGINNWGTWDAAVHTTGGTIKNITINSGMRGIFMGSATADVYIDNVTIDGTIYTFNSDGGNKNYGVYISNSTLNGWTSHSDVHKEVVYTNCEFGEGQGYAFCRPYGPTQFVDCDFADGFEIDAVGKITFENCTIGGVALTAENLATLVISGIDNASVK